MTMRGTRLVECRCESGEHFKCYCNDIRSEETKITRRFSLCNFLIKTKTKNCYESIEEEYKIHRKHSLNLSVYTIKKDFKGMFISYSININVDKTLGGGGYM